MEVDLIIREMQREVNPWRRKMLARELGEALGRMALEAMQAALDRAFSGSCSASKG